MSLTLDQLLIQEDKLQFVQFTHDVAKELGSYVHQIAYERELSVAIEVFAFDQVLFRFERVSVGKTQEKTLVQMRNHVLESGHSTQYLALNQDNPNQLNQASLINHGNENLEQTFDNKQAVYQFNHAQGGGFPLRLSNGSMIGAICCSGLTSIDDHNLVVEALHYIISQQALID